MAEQQLNQAETLLIETRGRVALITLNRPGALNALNRQAMQELAEATRHFDRDPNIGCIVITGSEKAFAAGADIKEMQHQSFMDVYLADWFSGWEELTRTRKPMIAAVSGYALGGGCELAMMCDIIYASETAKFGQPEIKLGVIPGMGGTQRLTLAIGKSKAMEMFLTGRVMDAAEAERSGLVAKVFPVDRLLEEALKTAETIAAMSMPATMMMKEAVNRSFEVCLAEGIRFERRAFHSIFATQDKAEGMSAFVEKRTPNFSNS
ncbi:enoyl-CoA hydratase [Terriglobus albidus]|uniref:enoyl-CoA hydratase n=1 Tax=Terriglobus albidus TaxID=1592106 RepID=A0A5B9E837_9BACT|nr:enoyl-CoA hydratase [Terriglobus albidus]QEE27929.1 enoyl-CoA hydratase [Terriglobus albidus]